jgi:DNA-binding NarL/FixJ family response regulator
MPCSRGPRVRFELLGYRPDTSRGGNVDEAVERNRPAVPQSRTRPGSAEPARTAEVPVPSRTAAMGARRLRVAVVGPRTPVRVGAAGTLRAAGMVVRESPDPVTRHDGGAADVVVIAPPDPIRTLEGSSAIAAARAVMLGSVTPAAAAAAVRAGVVGVLDADVRPAVLVSAVRGAAAGLVVLPRVLARSVVAAHWPADVPRVAPEELEWMRRFARGATVADVAASARLSQRELHRRLSALYSSLGVRSRVEAAVFLAERGLLGR